ncbi:MAG: DUF302 domain-containing protein [Solirubrobacteraceae bacterium]|jgi:uncharacterized protein (DUF302 family)
MTDQTAGAIVTKPSPWSVADTISRIEQVLASKGIKLFAVIDHSGEAHAAGLELRETRVVIFGNPAAGTAVMEAVPLAALDLPLKVLVWADGNQTQVSYTPPAALAARYGLSADLAGRLTGVEVVVDAALARG